MPPTTNVNVSSIPATANESAVSPAMSASGANSRTSGVASPKGSDTPVLKAVLASGDSQSLAYSVDPSTKEVIVKVIDRSTSEVIRQVPEQEVLDIAKSIDRMQGLLVNSKT